METYWLEKQRKARWEVWRREMSHRLPEAQVTFLDWEFEWAKEAKYEL